MCKQNFGSVKRELLENSFLTTLFICVWGNSRLFDVLICAALSPKVAAADMCQNRIELEQGSRRTFFQVSRYKCAINAGSKNKKCRRKKDLKKKKKQHRSRDFIIKMLCNNKMFHCKNNNKIYLHINKEVKTLAPDYKEFSDQQCV